MKQHYTIVQGFSALEYNKRLDVYLDEQNIEYTISAEFISDLNVPENYKAANDKVHFVKKVVALIEEHELSAIMLSVDGVAVIGNDRTTRIKNRIRKMFSWFV